MLSLLATARRSSRSASGARNCWNKGAAGAAASVRELHSRSKSSTAAGNNPDPDFLDPFGPPPPVLRAQKQQQQLKSPRTPPQILITGVGIVSSLGPGARATWEAVAASASPMPRGAATCSELVSHTT